MWSSKDYDVQMARRHDMEREARTAQLVAAAHTQHEASHAVHAHALAKMGELLVNVGSRLQERYGTLIEEASQKPVKAC